MPIEKMSFLTLSFTIFILLNAYSQIPLFIKYMAPFEQKKQKFLIMREMVFALLILFIFIFFGNNVLNVIGVQPHILGIAGGFLLTLIGINMVFPKEQSSQGMPAHEPFVVPLAMPGIAGPGTITALMVLTESRGILFASSALMVAWIPSLFLLLLSPYIKNYLGEKGLQAIERLGGMIIVMIGIQMISTGALTFINIALK